MKTYSFLLTIIIGVAVGLTSHIYSINNLRCIAMSIIIELDVMLARRKMKLQDLAEQVGITVQNLSILKNGKAKAVRLETLDAICLALDCQPGDILRFKYLEARAANTRVLGRV